VEAREAEDTETSVGKMIHTTVLAGSSVIWWVFFVFPSPTEQGCHIFLGTTYQNRKKCTKKTKKLSKAM
jgi:hypothetical protein